LAQLNGARHRQEANVKTAKEASLEEKVPIFEQDLL